MFTLPTCAITPFPHPRHLLQTNKLKTNDIKKLKSIHARETHSRTKPTLLLFNLYLQLYASIGLMHEAHTLFDKMPERTLISWTILMSGYTRHGFANETLGVFQNMVEGHANASLKPDSFVYAIVLRACSIAKDLDYGRQLHCRVLKTDGVVDSYVENALLSMYASSGAISDAACVFEGIVRPDLVSWSSFISGYVQNGMEEEGLSLFGEMIRSGVRPDVTVFSMAVGASANLGYLDCGIQMHCHLIKLGLDSFLFLQNTLMNFYVKCGDLSCAVQIFKSLPKRDLVSVNTIMKGYIHNHCYHEALEIFSNLVNEGTKCDDFTLTYVLQAVAHLGAFDLGREIHGYIIRAGFKSDVFVVSSLLDMYTECIDYKSISPTGQAPLKTYNHMEGFGSDEFIIASVLKWCSLRMDLETGKALHSQIIKHDFLSDSYVISSLLDMYSKCETPEAAERIFERVKDKGMVLWAAMIAGCCWNKRFERALELFWRMQYVGVEVNEYIYTSILTACLALGDLRKAKELHCMILRSGYGSNVSILNTLINLYSKLWHPQRALGLCSFIPESEIVWSFLVEACQRIEDHETNFKLLEKIHRSYGKLDSTSASYFLSSSADSALLYVGKQTQAYLTKRGLMSDISTNNALIKMYSACGMLTDAITTFQSMPEKNPESWTALISVQVDHGNPFEALELLSQMRSKKMSLTSSTFVSVLKACAQMGLADEAFRLFKSMAEIHGIEPSAEHYSCMIEVLGRAGRFEDARQFIEDSIPLKLVPLIWRTFLSASRKHGNMKFAKYAAEKLLKREPGDLSANLLSEQILLTEGMWDDASKLKISNNFSWIEIRNNVYEFTSNQIPTEDIFIKLVELESIMMEMGYVADRNHLLHDAEEEEYEGAGPHHSEMKALAFGLLSLPRGVPVRIVKAVRMRGNGHSAFKFMSTFLQRELVVRDSCIFHHFRSGECSCKDKW